MIVMRMIISLNFPLRRLKGDSRQTVVLGLTVLHLAPIMDLFQMMGKGGTGLISWVWGNVTSCLFRALGEVQSRLALISLQILSADVFVHPSWKSGRKGKAVFICYISCVKLVVILSS